MMDIIFCLVSFMLGWWLSTWSKKDPISRSSATDLDIIEWIRPPEPSTDTAVQEEPNAATTTTATTKAAPQPWSVDFTYLNDADTITDNQDSSGKKETQPKTVPEAKSPIQTSQYFLDIFYNNEQTLTQRLEAVKAALAISPTLLDERVIQQLLSILQDTDTCAMTTLSTDEIVWILNTLESKIASDKLVGLAQYLIADEPLIREEALKTITRADTEQIYLQQVESILHNDPKSEVRALAFALLGQYYPGNTVISQSCAA